MFYFFFFNDTATTEIYTLSLHDALPILHGLFAEVMIDAVDLFFRENLFQFLVELLCGSQVVTEGFLDRKSTRLNSSHSQISYAVFCLKKKTKFRPRQAALGGKNGKPD